MRADNSQHLIAAARERAEQTRTRALRALRRLDEAGVAVTFEAIAREAGVSRSWLYGQADLRTEIEALRTRSRPSSPASSTTQRQRPATHPCCAGWKPRPHACASSRLTTTSCARPSPKPSVPHEQPASPAPAPAATRPGGQPRNSSGRADSEPSTAASTTPSTTQTRRSAPSEPARLKITWESSPPTPPGSPSPA